jgi:hypothetical protein
MKKNFRMFFVLLLLGSTLASPAYSASNAYLIGKIAAQKGFPADKKFFGPGCFGRTDYAHNSTHKPFTVNATVVTECKGRIVHVEGTIVRANGFIFDIKSDSATGKDKVTINISLPCKWKPGQKPISYMVVSSHSATGYDPAFTGTQMNVKC